VVRVGVVDPLRRHVVELLPVGRHRVGPVDDVEDLEAAEAGDLDGTYASDARG
jgi:hypothetical protein